MEYSDKQILDWLMVNCFKYDQTLDGKTQRMFFRTPTGRAGDIRWILEGAMEKQGVKPDED